MSRCLAVPLLDKPSSCFPLQAADHYDLNGNGVVSIEEFRLALNEYLDAQDEGKTPDWFTE